MLPKVIGFYRHLVAYPDLFGDSSVYAIRPVPAKILARLPKNRLNDHIQAQVISLGELTWINIPKRDFKPIGLKKDLKNI